MFNIILNELYLCMSIVIYRVKMFRTTPSLFEKSMSRTWYMCYWSEYTRRNLSMSTRTLWNLVSWRKTNEEFWLDDVFSCELISACGSNPCVQGICQNKNETTFQCICKPGFTGNKYEFLKASFWDIDLGKTCDISFDICHTNPCKLGSIIEDKTKKFECLRYQWWNLFKFRQWIIHLRLSRWFYW
jgi:hypothetical protein